MKERASSQKTLVLGLGNPLSGDDAFGARVLGLLHQSGADLLPGVFLEDAHTDLLNHIDSFAGYDRVVLIDAILDPDGKIGKSGRVLVLSEESFFSWSETSQSVHQISPLLAVKLFRTLYPASQTQIYLVGLLVDQITHSPRYATPEALKEATSTLRTLLTQ